MKGSGGSISRLGISIREADIQSYQDDIDKLLKMKTIYNDTENLCGGFYSDMIKEINSQIEFCEMCIKNLEQ